jgi:BlaI family transcriptional regulator, penicillinase repressor
MEDELETPGLSELQLALMQAIWTRGEASNAEVLEALRPQRDLAHTTVATLLTRLEKRGLLASRREGRTLVYRSLVEPEQVQRAMVGGLLSRLFEGKPSRLLAHLVGEGQVSDDELAQMRALLARHAKEKARG